MEFHGGCLESHWKQEDASDTHNGTIRQALLDCKMQIVWNNLSEALGAPCVRSGGEARTE